MPAETVIDELVRDAEGGLMGSGNGRFFGWVIGGTLPVALAADWLTSTWDQNAASNVTAPAEAVVEQVCGEWAKEMFGLPKSASFAFVTGCQMAHTTALASARHKLLRDRGWDVEAKGLSGASPLRILTTENRHESILRSARLLGVGTDAIVYVQADNSGRIEMSALEQALREGEGAPTVVCLQAGDLNTGVFDPFEPACRIAHAAKAWVHVDGAFGLWAAVNERHRPLLAGAELADSWATDGHKWLNLPFDSGLVFVPTPRHTAPRSRRTPVTPCRPNSCAIRRTGIPNGRAAVAAFRFMRRCVRSAVPASASWSIVAAGTPSAWCARSARSPAPKSWLRLSSTRGSSASSARTATTTDSPTRSSAASRPTGWRGSAASPGAASGRCASRSATG